jgi:hypothetical protein
MPVMTATAKPSDIARRRVAATSLRMYMMKSPFEPGASKSHQTEADQCNVITALTVPSRNCRLWFNPHPERSIGDGRDSALSVHGISTLMPPGARKAISRVPCSISRSAELRSSIGCGGIVIRMRQKVTKGLNLLKLALEFAISRPK